MRSPISVAASFTDLVDTYSAIYSLISFGRERFIAGGACHSLLKFFDLRMPGGKLYHAGKLDFCSAVKNSNYSAQALRRTDLACFDHRPKNPNPRDWNVFLNLGIRGTVSRTPDSPVYSLSSPSPCSPSFYAGVEGRVVQIDMVSMMEPHPDPVFRYGPEQTGNLNEDIVRKWDPQEDALRLPMYEQEAGNVTIMRQQKVGYIQRSKEGWDERW